MKIMTLAEYHDALRAQGVGSTEDFAMVCPMCGTVQSARDLIEAGAGATFEEVDKYLGFSCVGRWTGAPAPRREPDGRPCNWTLGGLLTTHQLEVRTPDGHLHPRFMPASPDDAREHAETFTQSLNEES